MELRVGKESEGRRDASPGSGARHRARNRSRLRGGPVVGSRRALLGGRVRFRCDPLARV
jgi:hypothetical protein